MGNYFPAPKNVIIGKGIESLQFDLEEKNKTQIILSIISPGAIVDSHNHPELQMGLALDGRFIMQVANQEKILEPLATAYAVQPNILHTAKNCFTENAIGFDIKRLNAKKIHQDEEIFLTPVKEIQLSTGIKMRFFVSSWCEIMLSEIPHGASMPAHSHAAEQIGIAVKGKYIMQVGNEEEIFEYGKVYYSPPNISHGAFNPYKEEAVSLNIFIPPRYNLPPKYPRNKDKK